MQKIIVSTNYNTIEEWQKRDKNISSYTEDIKQIQNNNDDVIILVDYDSVASAFNKLLVANEIPKYTIVLEKNPAIVTGKMLLTHGVKAYGNSRMLKQHYEQMTNTVQNNKIWSYPELTAALAKNTTKKKITPEAQKLLQERLTSKEQEIVHYILEGFTNEAIAHELNIAVRTVKAHISAIFEKLHVNDRLSLALLLLT